MNCEWFYTLSDLLITWSEVVALLIGVLVARWFRPSTEVYFARRCSACGATSKSRASLPHCCAYCGAEL